MAGVGVGAGIKKDSVLMMSDDDDTLVGDLGGAKGGGYRGNGDGDDGNDGNDDDDDDLGHEQQGVRTGTVGRRGTIRVIIRSMAFL